MHIDLRFFIAELLVLWVPLSIVVLASELLKFNWLLTGVLLLLGYFLVVLFNRSNRLIYFLFHVEKKSCNQLLESILFLLVLLISAFLSIKFFDDSTIGIIVFMFVSILAGSVVIDAK
ncbi:hypothetical protein AKUH4B507X_14040 [Apilactobacillus kunkeei]|nr:hypothetical protein AKUH3B109M_12880 [Apilactobacillus kunkeei]CAI2654198.1 hypothetical protein AKUH4B402J_12940 [Apilactobacillus kunkeei]CAI2658024.1 hypothetical protein AKUH3B102A_13800 [Apilactobacillus kunkeei]CAI2658268.1 hypothetical protein AKUH3B101A_13570 [Apilactobacillus kunkeei]CAI2658505.1 hypothetical protein AKUH3B203J_13700 [Apilactobacillus kunkeei]